MAKVKEIPILMYHKVGRCPPGTRPTYLWVTPRAFRRQIGLLKRRGCTSMLLSEFRDVESGKIPMPKNPVLITFDDGFANIHEVALPILKDFGMKGNVFLICDAVGGDSAWDAASEPVVPMLTWTQARDMRDSGVIEFGSHSMSHPHLRRLPAERARWEITMSKRLLEEKLDREILGFAYPYGDGAEDPAMRRMVRKAGYRYDFGTEAGVSSWPWDPAAGSFRRLTVKGHDSLFLDLILRVTRGRGPARMDVLRKRISRLESRHPG